MADPIKITKEDLKAKIDADEVNVGDIYEIVE